MTNRLFERAWESCGFRALAWGAFLMIPAMVHGLDGGNSVYITTPTGIDTGWKTFEILTGNDALGGRAKEGFVWTVNHDDWDGLGAYRLDAATLRVFINHEAGPNSTFSRVDLDLGNLRQWIVNGAANNSNVNQVAAPGAVVTAVSRGWLTLGAGSNPINNPCSANVWMPDTFGAGRGFAEMIYLTGEETFNNAGKYWVMDVATRTIYEAPSLGLGSWESATPIDTGRTDTVALLLGEDAGPSAVGTAPLRLYVGLKNPAGNFLQRNGLSGGTVYHWDPVGASTNGTMAGIFAAGNGTVVSGTWVASSTNAARFSKLEDMHTNMQKTSPTFGVEVAFASQNQAVFTVEFTQVDFVAGDLGPNRESDVMVLFKQGTQAVVNAFGGMDNLVWSGDGNLYVNEDDGEGDLWKIDVNSLKASYALGDFTPDATQVFDILATVTATETSGIIDISEHVGYAPGGVFLTAAQSGTLANNQLVLLVSPEATSVSAFDWWISGYKTLTGADTLATADPDEDGIKNLMEYACGLNPDLSDRTVLEEGTGTSGLPRVELRPFGADQRLVIEYLRRKGDPSLDYMTQFTGDLADPIVWGAGGAETVTPIDDNFERVVRQDSLKVSEAPRRFACLRVSIP